MNKQIRSFALCAGFGLCSIGCSGGEFRAEEVPTKAQVQKDIDQVKSNTNIPEAAKSGILKGLEKKMEHAKG